jgi:hypothetical protein
MSMNVTMTLRQALRQLESERGHIDRQIAALRGALDGLGAVRRRGRPSPSARPVRRRRRMSAAVRRALSQRMKAYWAKRRAVTMKGKSKGRGIK